MIDDFDLSVAARTNCLSTSAPDIHLHVAETLRVDTGSW